MVEGVARLKRRLVKVTEVMRQKVRAVLAAQADIIVATMRQFAPRGETGKGVGSIGWVWGRVVPKGAMVLGTVRERAGAAADAADAAASMVITIYAAGDDAFYMRFQEFGTVKMAASPFFYPAYRLHKKKIKREVNKAVREAIKSSK